MAGRIFSASMSISMQQSGRGKNMAAPNLCSVALFIICELHNSTFITEIHAKHDSTLVTDNLYRISKLK
jgi:hypothetical protein